MHNPLVTISQSFRSPHSWVSALFLPLLWKPFYFITPRSEARTAALHGSVCSYRSRVLHLTYLSNSTRSLKEKLRLVCRLNWVLFWFQGHCPSQGGCGPAALPPPQVPWDHPTALLASILCILPWAGSAWVGCTVDHWHKPSCNNSIITIFFFIWRWDEQAAELTSTSWVATPFFLSCLAYPSCHLLS